MADLGEEMPCSHKIDVGSALLLKFKKNISQSFQSEGDTGFAHSNAVILTEDTLQAASGKKYGAGTTGAGNTGLLPVVQGGSGRSELHGLPAEPRLSQGAVDMALPGTKCAVRQKRIYFFGSHIHGKLLAIPQFQGFGKVYCTIDE